MHRLHVLCLVARTHLVNKRCMATELQATLLSLLPSSFAYTPYPDMATALALQRWLRKNVAEEQGTQCVVYQQPEQLLNVVKQVLRRLANPTHPSCSTQMTTVLPSLPTPSRDWQIDWPASLSTDEANRTLRTSPIYVSCED